MESLCFLLFPIFWVRIQNCSYLFWAAFPFGKYNSIRVGRESQPLIPEMKTKKNHCEGVMGAKYCRDFNIFQRYRKPSVFF